MKIYSANNLVVGNLQNFMEITIVQVILGILLFFIINWIGKHSYSIGYMGISIFTKAEEAPALNFLIRVLTPIVYLIIISTILYSIGLDKYVLDIFWVNVYYVVFRLLFNLATSRGLLMDWFRQFIYWAAIISISYFVYEKIIKVKTNILPDFTTLANELWIIILLFLFQICNNIQLSPNGIYKRKQSYLKSRYKHFKKKYGLIIKDITKNEVLETVTYAILIYEDFNRPKLARIIEYLRFSLTGKEHTLGVMQYKSKKFINDKESVILGTKKIVSAYIKYVHKMNGRNETYYEWDSIYNIVSDYNVGDSYVYEVVELSTEIKELYYKKTQDTLGMKTE